MIHKRSTLSASTVSTSSGLQSGPPIGDIGCVKWKAIVIGVIVVVWQRRKINDQSIASPKVLQSMPDSRWQDNQSRTGVSHVKLIDESACRTVLASVIKNHLQMATVDEKPIDAFGMATPRANSSGVEP